MISGYANYNNAAFAGEGDRRRRWRGLPSLRRTRAASFDDICDDPFEIIPNVSSANAHRLDSASSEPRVSPLVALRIRPKLMREPVHLNCECRFVAKKVEIIGPVLMLPSELEAVRPLLESVPEAALRRSHGSAEFACPAYAQKTPPSAPEQARGCHLPSKSRGGEFTQTPR